MQKQYTLGRGRFHFADAATPAAFRYVGNTPEFNLTISSEVLDHFDDDEGVREKDDSVDLETNRTGSFVTDNINLQNVAMFFFGSYSLVTQAAVPAPATETFLAVSPEDLLQLGVTPTNPFGYRGIDATAVVVEDEGGLGTTYVVDVDYEIDEDAGTIYILSTGSIAAGTDLDVDYAVQGSTFPEVLSGATARTGAARYIAKNPKGPDIDYHMPSVKVGPNGDYNMKGQDWQRIPFSLEILKPANGAAIMANGVPVYV